MYKNFGAMRQFVTGLSNLLKWARNGYAAPAPTTAKKAVLFRHGYPKGVWIETGTWKGHMTAFLSELGQEVFTIEPQPRLFEAARSMFASKSNVTCVLGTSEQVFEKVCSQVRGGALNFWLDGHYSAGSTFKGVVDTPIKYELNVISKHLSRLDGVCILIDDVRCFTSNTGQYSDYPPLDYLVDFARKNGLVWSIEHDIFIARSAWRDSEIDDGAAA